MQDNPQGRTPKYWRDMAEETRALADSLTIETKRAQMLAIAENYDRLAEEAEREQRHSLTRAQSARQ
jgi:hypothetical protein